MNEVKFQVLGFKNFNRKSDGKAMTIITCVSPCSSQDMQYGLQGNKATDFFLPDDKVNSLTLECVGQEFIPEYAINGFGRPEMVDFTLRPWK